MELFKASNEWARRPADERYTSLTEMRDAAKLTASKSREVILSTHDLSFKPSDGGRGVEVWGANGHGYAPTNWAFGQICGHAGAPAGHYRTLPSELVADALNFGFHKKHAAKEAKILLEKRGESAVVRAMTSPTYGRVWDHQIITKLIEHYGDGHSGKFRVPGVWGTALDKVTTENTTLYRGDRSMFVFLTDEVNKIELPNRRDGKPGELSRGFFIWQSEVMASAISYAVFLFDKVCQNRIVWGAEQYGEYSLRHTVNAPNKWEQFVDEMVKALDAFSNSSTASIEATLKAAQALTIDDMPKFIDNQFGRNMFGKIDAAHKADEGRPMFTVWDAVTGATAFARSIPHQEPRIEIERLAGNLLTKVAA